VAAKIFFHDHDYSEVLADYFGAIPLLSPQSVVDSLEAAREPSLYVVHENRTGLDIIRSGLDKLHSAAPVLLFFCTASALGSIDKSLDGGRGRVISGVLFGHFLNELCRMNREDKLTLLCASLANLTTSVDTSELVHLIDPIKPNNLIAWYLCAKFGSDVAKELAEQIAPQALSDARKIDKDVEALTPESASVALSRHFGSR